MYPYQRNQAPYAPVYSPSVPPQVKVDPARLPAAYESRPWDGSFGYGYPYPVQCCNHNYYPGHFMLRPSYPCVPAPHCHGYALTPGPYPVHYFPPHYMMDIPHYEFDRDMQREHHCWGCPNHPCSQKDGKSIKIEEEEPGQMEMKGNQSLVPYEFKNFPYPIVWLPPDYMKAKEQRITENSEDNGHNKSPRGVKYSKSFDDQPTGLSGRFPFDAKNCQLLKQGEDETGSQHNQDADNSKPSGEQHIPWNWWFPFDAKNLGSLKQGEDQKRGSHNQDAEAYKNPKPFKEQPRSWNGWFPVDVNKLQSLKPGEDKKRSPHNQDVDTYENSKSSEEPSSWNGWVPVDMNKLRSMKPGEGHKRSQHGRHEEQSNFSLPIFGMPDRPGATEEESKDTFIKQGPATYMESTPVKHHNTEGGPEVDIKDEGSKLLLERSFQ